MICADKQLKKKYSRKTGWGYFFLIPWFLVFAIFYVYPLIYGICVSFTDYNLSGMKFIGLDNYVTFLHDYAFWRSLLAMFLYCLIVVPLRTIIPLWAANTLRPHGKRFNTITKLLIYLPGVVCTSALVISWKFILSPGTGILSVILKAMGFGDISLLDSAKTSIPILSILIVLSNLGGNLIVYCAAVNAIPRTYYEVAEIDGASHFKQFIKVTIPMLHSTTTYVLITSTIASLQIFIIPQLLTGGGPNYTTSALLMLVYSSAFINNKFGYASAIGVVLFVITAVVAAVQFRLSKRDNLEY